MAGDRCTKMDGVSEEGVDDTQVRKLLAVLKILAVENAALAFDSRGYDQCIAPGNAVYPEEVERFAI